MRPNGTASLSGKDILLLDDAEDIRLLAGKILSGDGANVIPAVDVDQAMGLAKEKIPHIFIIDLEMPVKTGFDFLEAKRFDTHLKDIPVIVLSGLKDKISVQKAISLGAADYILKPFRATLLLQKIRKALKLSSFLKRTIDDPALSVATLSVPTEIIRMNETGCQIDCAVKISPNENIQLTSDLLKSLQIEQIQMKSTEQEPQFGASGRYICEINFIGMDPELVRKIRRRGIS